MAATADKRTLELRRVTALIGPYGSGKTELAIGFALLAARLQTQQGQTPERVVLGDLDVLKPYFRSREATMKLAESGVQVIAPQGALSMSDLPIIPAELRGALSRTDLRVMLDVGGDPVGARALGSLSDVVPAADYDLLLVLNRHRPFMDEQARVIAQAHEIVAATHLSVTGIISNTHMLQDTSEKDVLWGLELALSVAESLDTSVRLLSVSEHLVPAFRDRPGLPPLFALSRHMMPNFLGGLALARPTRAFLPTGSVQ
jgi:hypothetical protein